MNRSAEELITQEHESMKAMKEVAESGSISAMYLCISDVANDVNCNARWGNAAQVFVTYKATVEDILMKTERGELSTREALQRIADACAEAKNDQRDGLLLIEQLFGIHDGSEGTASRERKLFEACGTTDWMEIHRTLFPGIWWWQMWWPYQRQKNREKRKMQAIIHVLHFLLLPQGSKRPL